MKGYFTFSILCLMLLVSCSKQNNSLITNNNNNTCTTPAATVIAPSVISVFINKDSILITAITYNRGGSNFNFLAQNKLQKVSVDCFWFYQQSRWSFQYSDSITYSVRPDTLTDWKTTRASNWGNVNFDCCNAPLTDTIVDGEYSGNFFASKDSALLIHGNFHLVFQ